MNRRNFLKTMAGGLATLVARNAYSAQIKLPDGSVVNTSDKVSPHFTWGDVTHNGERIPQTLEILANVKRAAGFMEEIREAFGNRPISVNSWYRDPETNNRLIKEAKRQIAAGKKVKLPAENSLHMRGTAVDFNVRGYSPSQTYKILDAYWGARGGVGRYSEFVHVDDGPKRRW